MKNKTMRLASVLLIAVLMTTSVISGTFAKYTTKYTATDSAKVATFKVSAFGEVADAATETVTVDLFKDSAVYDTKDETDFTDGGVDDSDIKNGSGQPIIAPGSWGFFTFDVKNDSEVTVEYTIDYDVAAASVPLQFSITGNGTDWAALEDVNDPVTVPMGETKTVKVYWQWDFDGDDTSLGLAGTATPSITVNVTITQVD